MSSQELFCTWEEAVRIASRIKDLKDAEKLQWYLGYVKGRYGEGNPVDSPLSLCRHGCFCMTRTKERRCAKCGGLK